MEILSSFNEACTENCLEEKKIPLKFMGIWTDLVFQHIALCKQLLNVLDSPSVNATDQLCVSSSREKGNNTPCAIP